MTDWVTTRASKDGRPWVVGACDVDAAQALSREAGNLPVPADKQVVIPSFRV